MNQASLDRDQDFANGTVSHAVNADFPIALGLGQPRPLQSPQQLEIWQTTILAVESHQFGLKIARSRLLHHLSKMIVLGQTSLCLVVDAKITR
jgi:hypothetical protein